MSTTSTTALLALRARRSQARAGTRASGRGAPRSASWARLQLGWGAIAGGVLVRCPPQASPRRLRAAPCSLARRPAARRAGRERGCVRP